MSADGHDYDVIIVGAGIAGAVLAAKLAAVPGIRIGLFDAGDTLYLDPADDYADRRQPLLDRFYRTLIKTPNSPVPDLKHAPSPDQATLNKYYVQRGPYPFLSDYARIVGGTTYHWLGLVPRLHPNTLRMKTLYGIGEDWPITYAELEDWYYEAEKLMGTSGDDADYWPLKAGKSPRKHDQPFPMPPLPPTYSDTAVMDATRGMTWTDPETHEVFPVDVTICPAARNTVPYGGRPACSGSANCIPICPTRARFDATVPLAQALRARQDGRPVVDLVKGAVLTEVELDQAEGRARIARLRFKRSSSRDDEMTATARWYVLAMHAIETPKVLLMSRRQRGHGVANSSDLVGRYLMDHDIAITWARVPRPLYPYRGPRITSVIESLRDGRFRSYRAASRPELSNSGTSWETGAPFTDVVNAVNAGLTGEALRKSVGWSATTVIHIDAMIEPEPDHDSRIVPSESLRDAWGIPRPELRYRIGDYSARGRQAFFDLATRIYQRMGATKIQLLQDQWFDAGHVMGTLRMGDDPRRSVCDSFGRTHDHDNLYLAGSGLFPTVGVDNPTLTLVALALRTARQLRDLLSRT